jgi:PIN domain nuclease of toxin-antitoxin system
MKLLLDTHILLWAALGSDNLSERTKALLNDPAHELYFSVASLWELMIKRTQKQADFGPDPRKLRHDLLENDYREVHVRAEHVLALDALPLLHHDPFDRILIAQARVEGATLVTRDARIVQYPGPIEVA